MKNVYHATRPMWCEVDRSELWVILVASILVVLIGAFGEIIVHDALRPSTTVESVLAHTVWAIIEVIAVTFLSRRIIRYCKRISLGLYPTTFVYCFRMPEDSNPDGRSLVVGFCHVKPNMEIGEFGVTGASFFWEDGQLESRVGFTSSHVWGSKENDEPTCHIRFSINADDVPKRLYKHGVLQFRLDKTTGLKGRQGSDVYAGYLQSAQTQSENLEILVRSWGYAEWHSSGPLNETAVQVDLQRRGGDLVAGLQAMFRATPQPTLWEGRSEMQAKQSNYWGHQIPTPQSVILDEQLKDYIDKLMNQVLSLVGLDQSAIAGFKSYARRQAMLDRDDTRVAYERNLKYGLMGKKKNPAKLNETLNRRARTIKAEIEDFLQGESLLDLGCGNGMIAALLKERFRVQLMDVVDYLPKELGLPFEEYKEGESIKGTYDTVLLLTVLHHSTDPLELLKLAWGATNKRLIIIESVVGIHTVESGVKYDLVDTSDENQIGYAAFIDWFYNRVLHDGVPVPYNFTTPEKWHSVFVQQGMQLLHTKHLGQDIDIGPEYHILFVLQKG